MSSCGRVGGGGRSTPDSARAGAQHYSTVVGRRARSAHQFRFGIGFAFALALGHGVPYTALMPPAAPQRAADALARHGVR
eukprot:5269117-Prymnesium_polylepis.1